MILLCHIRGVTGALPAFKVEIDALFEGTHVETRAETRSRSATYPDGVDDI